jgi:hypothetical protein
MMAREGEVPVVPEMPLLVLVLQGHSRVCLLLLILDWLI